MTRNKDFKRLVRDRMRKTGEAYTTARAQLLKKASTDAAPAPRAVRVAKTKVRAAAPAKTKAIASEFAALAGMTDATVKAKTGCDWSKWVRSLDHYGADQMTHTQITDLIQSKYKVDPWWSQMVAVGYERIRGLRARTQRRDGSFSASKSRTFNVPITTLFDAWANAATRKKWLKAAAKVRSSRPPKSIRLGMPDGSIAAAFLTAKGEDKCVVGVQQDGLTDAKSVVEFKSTWAAHLGALAEVLTAT